MAGANQAANSCQSCVTHSPREGKAVGITGARLPGVNISCGEMVSSLALKVGVFSEMASLLELPPPHRQRAVMSLPCHDIVKGGEE